jgi:hypothetical protein
MLKLVNFQIKNVKKLGHVASSLFHKRLHSDSTGRPGYKRDMVGAESDGSSVRRAKNKGSQVNASIQVRIQIDYVTFSHSD